MNDTFYQMLFLFFIYAFLGWCAEVVFHATTFGKFINRGFLNGPVCPIYGFGVILVLILLEPWKENGILLFFTSMIITSLLECLTGFILEKLFHARWWDYSEEPFHLGPYVCLKFSLMWGFSCVFVVRILQPFFILLISLLPLLAGKIILMVFYGVIIADFCTTVTVIRRILYRLENLDEIAKEIHTISDRIGEKLSDSALTAVEKGKQNRERLEELAERLEEKKAELQKRLGENPILHRRILKAFPSLHSNQHPHILEELRCHANIKKKQK